MQEPDQKHVSEEVFDLRLRALKSDLRLMIIASVALNQVLANVQLPTAVSASAIAVAVLAPVAKGVIVFFGRGS